MSKIKNNIYTSDILITAFVVIIILFPITLVILANAPLYVIIAVAITEIISGIISYSICCWSVIAMNDTKICYYKVFYLVLLIIVPGIILVLMTLYWPQYTNVSSLSLSKSGLVLVLIFIVLLSLFIPWVDWYD